MALIKNYQLNVVYATGFENTLIPAQISKEIIVDNAYIKITNTNGDKQNINMSVAVMTAQNGEVVVTRTYSFVHLS